MQLSDCLPGNEAVVVVIQSSPVLPSCQSDAQRLARQTGSPAQAAAALRSAAQALAYGPPSERGRYAAQLRQLLQTNSPQARTLILRALSSYSIWSAVCNRLGLRRNIGQGNHAGTNVACICCGMTPG
jgi:hypothetical protein